MHNDHGTFVAALQGCQKVRLTFFSKEDRTRLVRTCAPMDYGPSRRARDRSDRYHLWDFDSDTRSHVLSLPAVQIVAIEQLPDMFDPGTFVIWNVSASPWFLVRNWGRYS